MALPQPKTDALEARLATLDLPTEPGCLAPARADALSRLHGLGLPVRRDEYWKYTRPDTLTSAEVTPAALLGEVEAPIFDEIDRVRLVFLDGVFDADLLRWRELSLSYRVPGSEHYNFSLSYQDGEVDDTLEDKAFWKTTLGVRF